MSEEKFVNEQCIDSPLPNWPGHIVIPKELTAEQFAQWWEVLRLQDEAGKDGQPADTRPDLLRTWSSRWRMVLDWKIEGLKTSDIEETGLKLPSMQIALFVIKATRPLIIEAQSPPKLQRPSSDTSATVEAT